MLSFTNIALHIFTVAAFVLHSRGLDNTEFGKDKGDGLQFNSPSSQILTAEFEANVDDVQILRDVCPDSHCHGTKHIDLTEPVASTECCIKCECGDDCFELGNCCYDKKQLPGHTSEDKTEFCTQASIISSHSKEMPAPVSYMFYQSCSDTDNASLVSKCNVADPGNMDEFIPVHSATTGRNYRNKYCAECNKDVEGVVAWDSDIYCNNYFDLIALFELQTVTNTSLINLLKSEYVRCALYLKAPENSSLTKCLNPLDMIDRCDFLSPLFYSFGDKCMTYYSPIYTKHHIFKNVFCLMCNEFIQPLEVIYCGTDETIGHITDRPVLPIIRLLTAQSNSASVLLFDTTTGSDGCHPPEVFDEDINACINISCPKITLPAGDKCYPVFKILTNVNLDFRVIVQIPTSVSYDPGAVLDEVWTLFEKQYVKKDVCKSKIMHITVDESHIQVVVQTVITISKQTDIEEAFEIFVNNINVKDVNTCSLFKMDVAKAAVLPTTDLSVTLLFDDHYNEPCFAIAMTDLMFCHTIEISNFERSGNNTILTNDLIFYPEDYAEVGPDKVRVCLDKYLLNYKINRRQKNQSNGLGSQLFDLYCVLIISLLAFATSFLYT